ncbi:hypothetical protein ACIRSS_36690 [Amycolatopsis sp. NPDC101161]|uniref:hypothetical protein n=1 Tax=Amycolatopsis sp. NPDC101161 TaxID=3363940 RepID=UPI0037FD0970
MPASLVVTVHAGVVLMMFDRRRQHPGPRAGSCSPSTAPISAPRPGSARAKKGSASAGGRPAGARVLAGAG